MPDRDGELDRVLIGGREPVTIRVVDHDPRWAGRYADVERRVRGALAGRVLGLEHIGSTAVPGLAAKPIVDVLLLVADVADDAAYVPELGLAGLVLRVREPAHRMLRTPARDVHVHVYEPGRAEVRDYLDLRDWLRVDAADRQLYARTKRRLAEQPWADMNEYADAKSEVVSAVLVRARAWRAAGTG